MPYYREYPVPPLEGRQEVRDLLYQFFNEFEQGDNTVRDFERFFNGIIDIAVEEIREEKEE